MRTIGFATCREQPNLQASDKIVADVLQGHGVGVIAAPWNGPFDPFEEADLIVVRSTWDYAATPGAFLEWLVRLRACSKVFNDPALMMWNMSKRYMARLREGGVPIVPTRFCAPHPRDILAALDDLGLDEGIVKPVYGAGGSGLSIIRRDDADGLRRAVSMLNASAMVQPKLDEITSVGETSFVFIDGIFSHAVLKSPPEGRILCQEEHGGASNLVHLDAETIDMAQSVLDRLPELPLYVRVDAIVTPARFLIMEVEAIEPELFFNLAPEQAHVFAKVLLGRLS